MKKNIKNCTKVCPIRNILNRFGDKWSILVLLSLDENGKMRFNELSKAIEDVSQKMLTVTLRTLEADGFITRTAYPEIPPRVEYGMTDLGLSLVPLIYHLETWARKNMSRIMKSREKFKL
jgi:DNA-binding HxlR family transcriptional regulator